MKNFYRNLRVMAIIVTIIFALTIALNVFFGVNLSWRLVREQLFYNIYYGVPLTLANGYFFDFIGHRIPWYEKPRQRVFWGIIGSIVVTLGTVFLANFILWVLIYDNDMSILYSTENRSFYFSALIITLIITTALHAMGFFKEVQKERKLNAQLKQEKLEMELNALRAHVDPHFLFNSFNVLSGLIDEDPEKAQAFLAGLSKIYRYILEQRHEETSELQEEMNFAQRYLELQRMRFEDSIIFETEINEVAQQKKIPALTLQLLLENAIKHNGFSKENPLHILIKADGQTLEVQNNKRERTHIAASNKLGLQNIKDRYALLSELPVEILDQTHSFSVKLPLL